MPVFDITGRQLPDNVPHLPAGPYVERGADGVPHLRVTLGGGSIVNGSMASDQLISGRLVVFKDQVDQRNYPESYIGFGVTSRIDWIDVVSGNSVSIVGTIINLAMAVLRK